jgi:hypothetical protein
VNFSNISELPAITLKYDDKESLDLLRAIIKDFVIVE